MIILKCDKCKNNITASQNHVALSFSYQQSYVPVLRELEDMHLCSDCYDEFYDFMCECKRTEEEPAVFELDGTKFITSLGCTLKTHQPCLTCGCEFVMITELGPRCTHCATIRIEDL